VWSDLYLGSFAMRCKPSHNVVARVTSDAVSAARLVTNSLATPLGYMPAF
jgi:hypothetical protein